MDCRTYKGTRQDGDSLFYQTTRQLVRRQWSYSGLPFLRLESEFYSRKASHQPLLGGHCNDHLALGMPLAHITHCFCSLLQRIASIYDWVYLA